MQYVRTFIFLVFCLILSLACFSVHAEDELHEALKKRQEFHKKRQHEISINGGGFLGDQSHSSWTAGANYHFLINDTFGVGAAYAYSPTITDWSSNYGRSLRSRRQHFMDAELMISNDAAFRAGKTIIECDFYLTLGAGALWINEEYEPLGVVGGGLRVYLPWPWMALRVDVNTYMHYTPIPTGDVFSADMSMIGGVSFLFPVRKPPPLKEEDEPDSLPEKDEEAPQDQNSGKLSTQETTSSSSSGTETLTQVSTAASENP